MNPMSVYQKLPGWAQRVAFRGVMTYWNLKERMEEDVFRDKVRDAGYNPDKLLITKDFRGKIIAVIPYGLGMSDTIVYREV